MQDADRQASQLSRTPRGWRPGRRELFADEQVWEELERWEAAAALVRFSGGGGNQGSIAAVTLEDAKKRELARWGSGEGELPEALAAPIWGRYALFRGHPRITGLLMWDVQERQVVVAGERGGREVRGAAVRSEDSSTAHAVTPVAVATGDTSRGIRCPGAARHVAAAGAGGASRSCERCGEPLPPGLRARGALLLQALPAGRLARAAEGPPSLPAAQPA